MKKMKSKSIRIKKGIINELNNYFFQLRKLNKKTKKSIYYHNNLRKRKEKKERDQPTRKTPPHPSYRLCRCVRLIKINKTRVNINTK